MYSDDTDLCESVRSLMCFFTLYVLKVIFVLSIVVLIEMNCMREVCDVLITSGMTKRNFNYSVSNEHRIKYILRIKQ